MLPPGGVPEERTFAAPAVPTGSASASFGDMRESAATPARRQRRSGAAAPASRKGARSWGGGGGVQDACRFRFAIRGTIQPPQIQYSLACLPVETNGHGVTCGSTVHLSNLTKNHLWFFTRSAQFSYFHK